MPALLFDSVTLLGHGLRPSSGEEHSFRDLGLDDHETLRLHAREVVLVGAPARSMDVAADRLVVANPQVVVAWPDGRGSHVRVVAQHIEGRLRITRENRGPRMRPNPGGSVTVWYTTASPAPTVDTPGPGVEVTQVPDPQELWTRWQISQAHAVSNVTAIGADLI